MEQEVTALTPAVHVVDAGLILPTWKILHPRPHTSFTLGIVLVTAQLTTFLRGPGC